MSIVERALRITAPYADNLDRILRTPEHISPAAHTASLRGAKPSHNPVVLVPGYCGPPNHLKAMQRSLIKDGTSAHIFPQPENGVGDAREAARALAKFVQKVSRMHGGSKVDMVGHSRGGMLVRDAAANFLPIELVGTTITVGTPNYGIVLPATVQALSRVPFADRIMPQTYKQLLRDSEYVNMLNSRNLADDGVRQVSIYIDKFDGAVQPWDAKVLEPGWINRPIHSTKRAPHLTMMTKEPKVYNAIVEELQMAEREATARSGSMSEIRNPRLEEASAKVS